MFLIAASTVVNVSALEMNQNLPDSLRTEETHAAHDLSGLETFAAFD